MPKICIVDGCDKKRHVKIGYCAKHYTKFKRYGDPLAGRDNKFLPGKAPETCTIDGCNAKHDYGGLCGAHNNRKRKLGSPYALYESEKRKDKRCSVDSCDRKHYCKGFCSKHYQNWFKHGDPLHSEKSGPLYWLESHANHDGDECLAWPFAKLTNGYGTVQVRDGRKRIASRVMCELAYGEPNDPKMQSAHSCGNGHLGCVNPKHLRWATVKENAADKKLHGTHLYGSKAPWSKLSDDQVRYILQDGKDESADILADRFGVTKWAIYNIRQGRRWTGIDG